MRFAKKLIKSPGKTSLKYHLHKAMAGPRPARNNKTIHASELQNSRLEFCPRAKVLLDLSKKKGVDEFLTTSTSMSWGVSADVANRIVMTMADAGRAVMDWKCVNCGSMVHFVKRPKECSSCKCRRFDYEEPVFVSKESGVSGSIDLVVDIGAPKLKAVELKAVSATDFKDLVAPLAEAKWRTNLYLRLIDESGEPHAKLIDTDIALVFYVAKGGWGQKDPKIKEWGIQDGGFSPFKEYPIKRDDTKTETSVSRARAVTLHRRGKGPIPEGICPNKLSTRAGKCTVAPECFGKLYDKEVPTS